MANAPESVEVLEGLWLSFSTKSLTALLRGDPGSYRLCLGYAGWAPGQLENEIMVGGWLTSKASAGRIFDTPQDKVWDLAIRDLGFDPVFLVMGGGVQ